MTENLQLNLMDRQYSFAADLYSIEAQLDDSSSYAVVASERLRIVGKALHILGVHTADLKDLDGASVEDILEINNIYYRLVDVPADILTQEYCPMILFRSQDREPLLLYRKGAKNVLYSASKNLELAILSDGWGVNAFRRDTFDASGFEARAIEIYAPIQDKHKGPKGLVTFAFAQLGLKRSLVAIVVCSLILVLFELLIPILTKFLVGRVLPQQDVQLLRFASLLSLLIILGLSLVAYLQARILVRLQVIIDRRMQSGVWDRVMKLPMWFISRFSAGDLSSRVLAITQLQQVLSSSVLTTGLQLLFSFAYFILMFNFDRGLAIWALLFTIVSLTIIAFLSYSQIRLQRPLQELAAGITNSSLQNIFGLQQLRSAGSERFVLHKWLDSINYYALSQLRINRLSDIQLVYASTVSDIGLMLLFVVLTRRIFHAQSLESVTLYVVTFLAFSSAFQSFNSAVSSVIQQIAGVIGQSFVLWERAKPVLTQVTEPGYSPDATVHDLEGAFALRNVRLQFPCSSKPLFTDLSFVIKAGSHTAITGPTGCGKTTIVRLILGFTQADQGDVLIDDISINKLAIRHYRRQVGVVMQSIHFGAGSIYNLIRCGLPISRDKVWDCLEKAGFADEVNFLPLKLDTYISEGASNLSGGQKQKLAIARALVRDPRVLIMDEATSALDNRSQDKITGIIESLGITRISVAHRLSTIQSADHIIVINGGTVDEEGTPNELLRHGSYLQRSQEAARNL